MGTLNFLRPGYLKSKPEQLFHAANLVDPRWIESRMWAFVKGFCFQILSIHQSLSILLLPSWSCSMSSLPSWHQMCCQPTTVCPKASEWQYAKSQVTFTWKCLALNSCSPLIIFPALAALCLHHFDGLSILLSYHFDWLEWGKWECGV